METLSKVNCGRAGGGNIRSQPNGNLGRRRRASLRQAARSERRTLVHPLLPLAPPFSVPHLGHGSRRHHTKQLSVGAAQSAGALAIAQIGKTRSGQTSEAAACVTSELAIQPRADFIVGRVRKIEILMVACLPQARRLLYMLFPSSCCNCRSAA